jgi:hypothetical protein
LIKTGSSYETDTFICKALQRLPTYGMHRNQSSTKALAMQLRTSKSLRAEVDIRCPTWKHFSELLALTLDNLPIVRDGNNAVNLFERLFFFGEEDTFSAGSCLATL